MKKLLSYLLILCIALSMCVVSTAYDDSTEVSYSDLDYSKRLTVGTTATGTINNVTSPYIYTDYWCGWAADGYTVALEANVEYILIFNCDTVFDSEVNAIFLTGGEFQGSDDDFNGDALTDSVGVFTNGCSTSFVPETSGDYRVLCWNWFSDESYDAENEINYSVTVVPYNDNYTSEPEILLEDADDVVALSQMSAGELAFRVIRLKNDIDMTGVTGFETLPHIYYSDFYGDGHTISGLTVPFVGSSNLAYYYDLNIEASFENEYVYESFGAFVKHATDACFTNCSVNIKYTLENNNDNYLYSIGGLVGTVDDSEFYNCSAYAEYDISGDTYIRDIGGLAGYSNHSYFYGCYAELDLDAETSESISDIGGLVGESHSDSIEGCSAVSNIKINNVDEVEDNEYIGGLVGSASSSNIDRCAVFGNINVPNGTSIGGLIGRSFYNIVSNSFAEVDVSGKEKVGGLVGSCGDASILNCYSDGAVKGDSFVSGLGYLDSADVHLCYSSCTVEANSDSASFATGNGEASYCVAHDNGISFASSGVTCDNTVHQDFAENNAADMLDAFNDIVTQNNEDPEAVAQYVDWTLHPTKQKLITLKLFYVSVILDDGSDTVLADGMFEYGADLTELLEEANGFDVSGLVPDGYHIEIPTEAEPVKCDTVILASIVADRTRGDINGDGNVNTTDYIMLKRAVLGTYTLDEAAYASADINGDGKVNTTDYIMLKRVVLGTYTLG